jgi:hypothetical protein
MLAALLCLGCAWFLDWRSVVESIRHVPIACSAAILVVMTFDRFLMACKWTLFEGVGNQHGNVGGAAAVL